MGTYTYFSKMDPSKETLGKANNVTRLEAARYFATRKLLSLKQFLTIYSVSKHDKNSGRIHNQQEQN